MKKALARNNTIENIIVADDTYQPPPGYELVIIDDEVQIGWTRADENSPWKAPPEPERWTLSISLDQTEITKGTQVNATAEVRDQSGDLVDISGTYFVPIIRNADNWQAKLLEVNISNGQVTVPFTVNEPGIYTISMQDIYPTPKSELAESPILIVKETGQ